MGTGKDYTTDRIRNVVIVGHSRAGKSMLVDALTFVGGTNPRRAGPGDPTVTCYRDEEVAHQMSMVCTPAATEWMGAKLNLIDTPGFVDFAGEIEAGVRVADAAVVVVGARSGVGLGTIDAWERLDARGLPRIAFISKMDREGADFETAWRSVKERLSATVIPVEIPIGEGDDFHGIINLFSGKAHLYERGSMAGEYEESEIPAEHQATYERWRTELMETVATTDEALLERYLDGQEISRDEAIAAMARSVCAGELVPAFCGSALLGYGMRALLSKMVELLPSPAQVPSEKAHDDDGAEIELRADDRARLAALIFKTASEAHVGELSYFKVVSGCLENGQELLDVETGKTEKLGHVSVPVGRQRLEVSRLHAGDIGVVAKLKTARTNHTMCDSAGQLHLEPIAFPSPDTRVALSGVDRKDEDKLGEALQKLAAEDPTFVTEFDSELRQTIARGLGDLHLQVQIERLEQRFHVKVETEAPRVAYRETLRRKASGHGRHKKQTGGRGQFGDCHVTLEPLPRGETYAFVNRVVGGAIPSKYIPAVDKGIQEASERGILAGFPVIDFQATCTDGSHHSVDSSEMAFKIAGSLAFQKAAHEADPYLLEPVMAVEVSIPNDAMGDVTGDISHRRGRVLGMDALGATSVLKAMIPEAELLGYAASLRQMTHGRGHHTRKFAAYEEVPAHIAEKIIKERPAQAPLE
ncbi:MAG: elongation factor G [Deltaproteobacteria bacterium]|nr:elongation factor G [Deltaproteobacteria bacterium]MCB9787204.1 elongation factor G [Deltaproteobacteria bacterium]